MVAESEEGIRDLISQLQAPILNISTLLSLLSSPLLTLNLLPPQYRSFLTASPLPTSSGFKLSKHIPAIQRAILEHVAPTWEPILVEQKKDLVLTQYFCPDPFVSGTKEAGELTLLAYGTILSSPLTSFSIRLLARLAVGYPIDRLHRAVFVDRASSDLEQRTVAWEDCLRNVSSVPAKVANATSGKGQIPAELQQGTYFNNVSKRTEYLIWTLSQKPARDTTPSITWLLTKLVNIGVFPLSEPASPSQPSFWHSTVVNIRRRLRSAGRDLYSKTLRDVIQNVPSAMTQQAIIGSLFTSLDINTKSEKSLDDSLKHRSWIKREAAFVCDIIGPLNAQSRELWDNVSAVTLNKDWERGRGRILVCWAVGNSGPNADLGYLTTMLLVTICYFPADSKQTSSLAFSSPFISSIGTYISHLDQSVRRCGMLVAEVVAQRTGKTLQFDDWDGDEYNKPWARQVRQLINIRDVDAQDLDIEIDEEPSDTNDTEFTEEVVTEGAKQQVGTTQGTKPKPVITRAAVDYDSDDSLTGYASPSSSRSASPTPSELEEIEHDPTLGVGKKKIPRPVYLVQLGELVRSTSGTKSNEADQEADKIAMALDCGEDLIRRKRAYGVELDENAVNLTYGFVGLQDNFDLEMFDTKRQDILNALVACCPRKAALCIIEEFFKNQYSMSQRYAMLNALALGARELASLSVPETTTLRLDKGRSSFPSKRLPEGRHEAYLAAGDQGKHPVQFLLDGISQQAIDRNREATADKVPNYVRERQLRIKKPARVSEIRDNQDAFKPQAEPLETTFTDVAAECFVAPLINRFWLFLRNEQTREARTAHHELLHRYSGAGTGLILNAMVLTHFLGTLAVLVHAARNAPQWLAIIAPDALELAVTLGTRPISQMNADDDGNEIQQGNDNKEAAILTTALELVLVVLDGCLELDGGRTLSLEHTALLLGAGEWAGQVFSRLEKGLKAEGGGGIQEIKLKKSAAGVLLKVDELSSRWRRSMVDVR